MIAIDAPGTRCAASTWGMKASSVAAMGCPVASDGGRALGPWAHAVMNGRSGRNLRIAHDTLGLLTSLPGVPWPAKIEAAGSADPTRGLTRRWSCYIELYGYRTKRF